MFGGRPLGRATRSREMKNSVSEVFIDVHLLVGCGCCVAPARHANRRERHKPSVRRSACFAGKWKSKSLNGAAAVGGRWRRNPWPAHRAIEGVRLASVFGAFGCTDCRSFYPQRSCYTEERRRRPSNFPARAPALQTACARPMTEEQADGERVRPFCQGIISHFFLLESVRSCGRCSDDRQ